jgi:hypothetical protein
MIYCAKNPRSCNVKHLKVTEVEDLKRQPMLLHTDMSVILHTDINPLNAELNPICHLRALLGAHHILHVSRVRVNGVVRCSESRVL